MERVSNNYDKDTYVYESCFIKAGFKKGHHKYN